MTMAMVVMVVLVGMTVIMRIGIMVMMVIDYGNDDGIDRMGDGEGDHNEVAAAVVIDGEGMMVVEVVAVTMLLMTVVVKG